MQEEVTNMNMKYIRIVISCVLSVALYLGIMPFSYATEIDNEETATISENSGELSEDTEIEDTVVVPDYSWAKEYLDFCQARGIICGDEFGNLMPEQNLTREQMVKILIEGLSVETTDARPNTYDDITPERWSYSYILKYGQFAFEKEGNFNPTQQVTREEFLAMTMKLAGFGDYEPICEDKMLEAFSDCDLIDEKYYKLIGAGYDYDCIAGSDGMLNPKALLTRAEACSMLYKTITKKEKNQLYRAEPVYLIGKSEVTLEEAKAWAEQRGAAQIYIDIADLYWQYEEITGIRADVLYAQAAKETNFGKYTGQVKPEQNNWAGIKKYGVNGDAPEDHEDFPTPEDGVRGHFNHMGAYIGVEPVGEPHGRFKSVKSLAWAGTVKTVQQLSRRWCPNFDYGNSIIRDFLEPMKAVSVN